MFVFFFYSQSENRRRDKRKGSRCVSIYEETFEVSKKMEKILITKVNINGLIIEIDLESSCK